MEYVRLGKSGLKVARICLGCMTYGIPERGSHLWTLDEEKSRPLIKQAIELGINFIDTANTYSDGTSEEIVGRALRDFARREEIVLATKVYMRMRPGPNGGLGPCGGGRSRSSLAASLVNCSGVSLARSASMDLSSASAFWPRAAASVAMRVASANGSGALPASGSRGGFGGSVTAMSASVKSRQASS